MTLYALYIARLRKTGIKTKETVTKELHEFHYKSKTQPFSWSVGELQNKIDALYHFLRESFNEDFIQSQKEWVVNDYDNIKDIVIN